MFQFIEPAESRQDFNLLLDQAEVELIQASAVLNLYGGFEHTPEPEIWAFKEACDRWIWAQVWVANGGQG